MRSNYFNEKSDWFDPDWMFGIEKFDIVIGNPPYGFRNVLTKDEKIYFRLEKGIDFKSGGSPSRGILKLQEQHERKCLRTRELRRRFEGIQRRQA